MKRGLKNNCIYKVYPIIIDRHMRYSYYFQCNIHTQERYQMRDTRDISSANIRKDLSMILNVIC